MKRYNVKFPLVFAALSLMLLLWGCAKESEIAPSDVAEELATLSVSTRTGETDAHIAEAESTVKTLRLMVFNSSGDQVFNKQYAAGAGNPEDILKAPGGVYHILERLPKNIGAIKICLIANERSRWNLGRTTNKVTYALLKAKVIDFGADYADLVNSGNNNLDVVPGDGNFVMFAETSETFGENGASIVAPVPLIRTVAKVTLNLVFDLSNIVGLDYAAGDNLTFQHASIQHQPLESYLNGTTAYVEDVFMPTSPQPLHAVNTLGTRYEIDPVVFYIPEHLLSEASYAGGTHTYIQLAATYTTALGVSMQVSYRVPLGNGMQKLFTDANYLPTKTDYTISRNTHYMVNGTVNKIGEQDGVQLNLSIQAWDEVEIDAAKFEPYLNVSDLYLNLAYADFTVNQSDRLYFWSNMPQAELSVEEVLYTVYDGNPSTGGQLLGDLATIYASAVSTVAMTKYAPVVNLDYVENNGHVDLELNVGTGIGTNWIVADFKVRAGKLRRSIRVVYHQ